MRRPIRVLTLIDLIGPIGGAERLATQLAAGLDRDRFEPWVCVTRFDRQNVDEPGMAEAADDLEAAGVRVIDLGRTSSKDLAPWKRLASELRQGGVRVVHAHKFGSNLWGTLVARAAGTPVVVAHEHTWSFEGEPVRKLLDRHVIARGADLVLAVSREDRRRMIEIERMPPEKVRYVPNGAPASPPPSGRDVRAELGIAPDAPVVGTVGMLRPQKAFEVLIEAAASLRRRHPDAVVLIAGYGPERERLDGEVARHGVQDVVRFLGHRDDVPDLIGAFDVAVVSSDFEGMPLSVLEYMEAGLPVVTTRVGGLPDLITDGEHGLLVEPRDPAGLAAAIGDLLADPERRRAMGQAARARRRAEFDIETQVRRIEAVYDELLALRFDGRGPTQ